MPAIDPKSAESGLALVHKAKDRVAMQTEILGYLARTDPDVACARTVAALAGLPHGTPAYTLVARVWQGAGAADPQKALRLVEQLPAELRSRARAAALLGWAKVDPAAALAWTAAQGLHPSDMKIPSGGHSCQSMILEALSGDRAKTVAWLTSQPPSPRLDGLLISALWQAGRADRDQLFARLTPDARVRGVDNYVTTLAAENLAEARAWGSAQPAGDLRDAAIKGLVVQQLKHDAGSLESFTGAWPPGPDHDAALVGAVESVRHNNPLRGVELSAQIGDPAKRETALQRLVWSWASSDAAGARAWVAGATNLPASTRAALLQTIDRD